MTASSQHSSDPHWATLGPALPTGIADSRVLDVGGSEAPDRSSAALAEHGAKEIVRCEPVNLGRDLGEKFDLVYCRDSLQWDPHPMNLLTRLWHLTKPGGTLLLESRIVTAPELSRYGRFVAAGNGGDSPSYWLPGRLALRWMVEVSGYDIDRWLPERPNVPVDRDQASAYLRATRTDRDPALDLATPARSQ